MRERATLMPERAIYGNPKSTYSLSGGQSWMEGARGWEGRELTGMPTQSECSATFSPRFPFDSQRGKHRIGADDADYILETFPIVKLHDEVEFGEYRTKRVILERFGEYGEAIKRGNPTGFDLAGVMARAIAEGRASMGKAESPSAPKARAVSRSSAFELDEEATSAKRDVDEVEWMCEIRSIFSSGGARDRETAIKELATALGWERVGSSIRESISNALSTAVRRGILDSDGGTLRLFSRSRDDFYRSFLKDQFLAALEGRAWRERDDAIQAFARWLGYKRTSPELDADARSLINGLIREARLEADGNSLRRT